jgi:hypothetical protein
MLGSTISHNLILRKLGGAGIKRVVALYGLFLPGLFLLATRLCLAQLPAGTITGIVRDQSGGLIPGAAVEAISRTSGQVRSTVTNDRGEYSFPALLAGEYEIAVRADGFQRVVRTATVEAGAITRADFVLSVGKVSTSVRVAAASPQVHYESPSVSGLISYDEIEALPLNGRSFLELAKLEPGVQAPTMANRNRLVVPVLGAPAPNVGGARFTVDGGSVTAVALGGSQMGFSQESVQEFQVSTVNFDLSAGMTDSGAINVVTRAGGNETHGSGFYFYRDHNLSAYPALIRNAANPDPFFQRQQFGVAAGGPIRRDRVFYFATGERNEQRSVAATTLLSPDFADLSRITANPLLGALFSVRVDGRINAAHTAFVRYSHDGSRAFGPIAASADAPIAYPSNWITTRTRAEQTLLGLTSVIHPKLVNDVRLSYFTLPARQNGADQQACPGCLGIGTPQITVLQAGLVIGNSLATDNLERRLELNESLVWQRGSHRVRVGVDWERIHDRNLVWSSEPVTMTLFSPDRVRSYNAQVAPELRIPLPAAFVTIDDLLQLPVRSLSVGIGDPRVPQEDGTDVRRWNTVWLYSEDTWRLRDTLTLTVGLGWGFDGVLNHDLRKPHLLAPILGADRLGPTRNTWSNFSPTAGFAWTVSSDRKTVIRAAAGRFYRPQGLTSSMDAERAALGPPGIGRQTFAGTSILNPLTTIPGVPPGTPLDFTSPSLFTGTTLMAILTDVRSALAQRMASADQSVQQIQITKQASPAIFPTHVPNPSAVHLNAGVQRELAAGFVVGADLVYRHFTHVPQNGGWIDVNHYDSVRGPVIRKCDTTAPEADDPQALCSRGPINVQVAPFRFTYKGLLVRAEKRLSHRVQVLGSYAFSSNSGTSVGNGFNLDNWLQNTGPTPTDIRHIVNIAGALPLPWHFDLGFNFSYASFPPFTAYVSGIDFNGDGTVDDLLPGTTVNAFNRSMGRANLERLVGAFNERYAGTTDAHGTSIPRLTLPASYSFGDNYQTLDLRLTRSVALGHHVRLSLIAEAFNIYNASNLSGYTGDLTSSAFGQPTGRLTQIFGSGGPRAFQFASRLTF